MRSAATLYYATYLMLGGVESAAGTAMKSAFVSTSVVGTIIGSIAAGWLAKRYRAVSLFKNINLLLVPVGVVMFFVPPTGCRWCSLYTSRSASSIRCTSRLNGT